MPESFTPVTYVDGETIITAEALNAHQAETVRLEGAKQDKEEGKGLSDENYSSAEKTKLAEIEAGAQVNPGAATQQAAGLMSSTDKAKLDGVEAGAQVNPGAATQQAAGLMSSTDKAKLDGVEAGAQVNPGAATQQAAGLMSSTDKAKLDGVEAGAQVNPGAATQQTAGLMSAADKAKLDGLDETLGITGATAGQYVEIASVDGNGKPTSYAAGTPSGGSSVSPYTSNPADLGAAASPGSSADYSRGDHVHKKPSPADIGAYQKPSGGIPASDMASAVQTSLGKADTAYQKPNSGIPDTDLASGVQTSLGKADTAYQKPSGGIPASDLASGVIPTVPSAYTSNPEMDGTASPGGSTSWAKGDHVHPHDTSKQDSITAIGMLKGAGSGSVSAATAGTDYQAPLTAGTDYQTPVHTASIVIAYANWSGNGPYTQTVTISGATITANTKVDLQPDATAIAQLIADGVTALYISNTSGTLTAYAIGAATTANITVQCTYYETA